MALGKVCTKCGETKSYNEFSKDRGRKDGHQSQCKTCKYDTDVRSRQTQSDRNQKYERLALEAEWYRQAAPELRERLVKSIGPDPSYDQPPSSNGVSNEELLRLVDEMMRSTPRENQSGT